MSTLTLPTRGCRWTFEGGNWVKRTIRGQGARQRRRVTRLFDEWLNGPAVTSLVVEEASSSVGTVRSETGNDNVTVNVDKELSEAATSSDEDKTLEMDSEGIEWFRKRLWLASSSEEEAEIHKEWLEYEERKVGSEDLRFVEQWETEVPRLQTNRSLVRWLRTSGFILRKDQTPWEGAVRLYRALQRQIESLEMELSMASFKRKMRLMRKIAGLETRVTRCADRLFGEFVRILGFPVKGSLKYDKDEFDRGMEIAFGSLDREGSGVFCYKTIRQEVQSSVGANRVFSLYLGRKVFCPVSTQKKAAGLQRFYERVLKPRPETEQTEEMLDYVGRIADAVFTELEEGEEFVAPVHDSGCIELSKSKGGKREVFWGEVEPDVDPASIKYTVVPEAIYSGGKVRVITKDSARNLRFAYLNEYMNRRVQRCRWSIFGRTVSDWVRQNQSFLALKDGEKYLSGDLEAATDTFNPKFTERVFVRLRDVFGLPDDDVEQMKLFTTRAVFQNGEVQQAGQLMGSILSFPILCVVSFAAATWGSPFQRYLMKFRKSTSLEATECVRRYGEVGINGDDMVAKVSDGGNAWMEGVRAVGGIVSRGKSLLCDHAFTVNSELWSKDGRDGLIVPPSSIRPTLLCALGEDDRKCAHKDWLEYVRSPLIAGKRHFNVDRALRPYLPRTMGGCQVKQDFDKALPDILAWREASRNSRSFVRHSGLEDDARNRFSSVDVVRPTVVPYGCEGKYEVWPENYEDEYQGEKMVPVTITVESYKTYQRHRFGTHRPQWTRGLPDFMKLFQEARRRVSTRWLGAAEVKKLRQEYERVWTECESGLRTVKVPSSLRSALIKGEWDGTKPVEKRTPQFSKENEGEIEGGSSGIMKNSSELATVGAQSEWHEVLLRSAPVLEYVESDHQLVFGFEEEKEGSGPDEDPDDDELVMPKITMDFASKLAKRRSWDKTHFCSGTSGAAVLY